MSLDDNQMNGPALQFPGVGAVPQQGRASLCERPPKDALVAGAIWLLLLSF
jgi:hypothetical protein